MYQINDAALLIFGTNTKNETTKKGSQTGSELGYDCHKTLQPYPNPLKKGLK
jgi:hypothetical protein